MRVSYNLLIKFEERSLPRQISDDTHRYICSISYVDEVVLILESLCYDNVKRFNNGVLISNAIENEMKEEVLYLTAWSVKKDHYYVVTFYPPA